MKRAAGAVMWLFLSLQAPVLVVTLRCYDCTSEISWSHCDLSIVMKECTKEETRCAATMEREKLRDKVEFKKHCTTSINLMCDHKSTDDCMSAFCEISLCNFALSPGASLVASSFSCYACESTSSWDDCNDDMERKYCPSGFRKCSKTKRKVDSGFTYIKDCVVPDLCGNATMVRNPKILSAVCCGQDLCNGVSKPGALVVFIGGVVFATLMFIVLYP